MNKLQQLFFRALAVFAMILFVGTSSYAGVGKKGHSHNHDKHESAGMSLQSEKYQFKGETIGDIASHVEIINIEQQMKQAGQPETHRLKVTFLDAGTGEVVSGGKAAINFTDNHDETGHFKAMSPENSSFVADVILKQKGEKHFLLATVLPDQEKRKYHFHFTVK